MPVIKLYRTVTLAIIAVSLQISLLSSGLNAKTIPVPPEPEPAGYAQPEFSVSDGYFRFDGEPAVLMSGSIHYARVPRAYWHDRMKKAKAMGLNCISTYMFWNAHEKVQGEYDFSGNLDIAAFVRAAQEEGLWVILRPSPYVCAEWTLGGLPQWLLADPDMKIRSNDPKFLKAMARYTQEVGKQLAKLQITKGGPIIMVQIENEYGQFGNPNSAEDKAYNRAIYQQVLDAGFEVPLIRCDWAIKETVMTAHIDGVWPTMNFGSNAQNAFTEFDKFFPGYPKMAGEYWIGWFDHWGAQHSTTEAAKHVRDIRWMLDNDVSFNMYMVHGGTNFGFTSGANWSSNSYQPDTTSYDYSAAIDETGRVNDKFYKFRDAIMSYLPEGYKLPDVPEQIKRIEVPEFELTEYASFDDLRGKVFASEKPQYLEALGQYQGLAIYSTEFENSKAGKQQLSFSELKDRAIVIVNGERMATLDRTRKERFTSLKLPVGKVKLDILLENMGHINYSRMLMVDRKGLGSVTLDGKELTSWQTYTFPLEDLSGLKFSKKAISDSPLPVFYKGEFTVNEIGDTMLDMSGWGKGMVWVNGVNLGRYWQIGPQYTLFMPGCWLKADSNEIIVMDIEPTGKTSVRGVTEPIFGLKLDTNLKYARKEGEEIKLNDSELAATGTFKAGDQVTEVDFGKVVEARYLCLESVNAYNGSSHASCAELHLLDADGNRLNRDDWEVIYASSEELIGEAAGADNIIDNQPVTFWHSRWKDGGPDHPHQIVLDFGKVVKFKTLQYLPRSGNNPAKIKDFRIYVSKDKFDGLR